MSSLPASIKRIRSKTTEKRWRHHFSHYKSMSAFCCHGNQSFDLICPKTLCSLSPTPVMLHIKFDLGWPAGFRDIQVWKCGRRWRRTDDGPLLYYKLTLWAFGSGELIKSETNKLYSCSYQVIKLSFCFQLIPFLDNSLFSVHIINVTSANFWKNNHACQSECVLHQPCQM